jgi:hypothetical protein
MTVEKPVLQPENERDDRPLGRVSRSARLDLCYLEGFDVPAVVDQPRVEAVRIALRPVSPRLALHRPVGLFRQAGEAGFRIVSGLPDIPALGIAADAEAIDVEAHAASASGRYVDMKRLIFASVSGQRRRGREPRSPFSCGTRFLSFVANSPNCRSVIP